LRRAHRRAACGRIAANWRNALGGCGDAATLAAPHESCLAPLLISIAFKCGHWCSACALRDIHAVVLAAWARGVTFDLRRPVAV